MISVVMITLVPKFVSLEDYGLWQLFLFYYSYLGFFHLGWLDGIYLRYAGVEFDQLDKKLFAGQIYGILVLQLIFMICIGCWLIFYSDNGEYFVAGLCSLALLVFVHFNASVNFIMQITNRIKDYARIVLIERIIFLMFVCSAITFGFREYKYLYFSHVVAMLSVTIYSVYACRELLRFDFYSIKSIAREACVNLSVGIKLMLANIASMLLIGIVRYGISIGWDVATFGKVSLTLSISNFLLMFVSAISVAIFPVIKRLKQEQLAKWYLKIRNNMMVLMTGVLLSYYPIRLIVTWWLPKYADSLIYMAYLFPICLYETKMQLLVNTYFKSLRLEKTMLKVNVVSVFLSIFFTYVNVEVLHRLDLAVISITILYAVRCIISELVIEKVLGVKLGWDILVELLMIVVFVGSGILFNDWRALGMYALAYIVFCFWKRSVIIEGIGRLKLIGWC